jgi:hypothetical protein
MDLKLGSVTERKISDYQLFEKSAKKNIWTEEGDKKRLKKADSEGVCLITFC